MKTVLILGSDLGMTSLITKHIKEKYGDDVVVIKSKDSIGKDITEISLGYGIESKIIKSIYDIEPDHYYPTNRVGKGGRARNKSNFRRK